MWTKHVAAAMALAISATNALYSGFALESYMPTGDCRTQDDWEAAFTRISSYPGEYKSVRLYSSWECDSLEYAVPAAIKTGITILVGIIVEDEDVFSYEKGSLIHTMQQYGFDWMAGVVVGSETLYNNYSSPHDLLMKIYDVRGMINSIGCYKPVGHADHPDSWTDSANSDVIVATDFLGVNNYPYWKGISVDNGAANNDYWQTTDQVRAVSQGKDVWTTETGQPSGGDAYGYNTPSIQALQDYWWQVSCQSVKEMNYYFYDLDDFYLAPSFAIVDEYYNPLIDMTCH